MILRLDPADATDMFMQIKRAIVSEIQAGSLTVGAKLPAAVHLAEVLGVNRHTVLRAFHELEADGFVELRRGRGAVVKNVGTQVEFTTLLTRLCDEGVRLGLTQNEFLLHVRQFSEEAFTSK